MFKISFIIIFSVFLVYLAYRKMVQRKKILFLLLHLFSIIFILSLLFKPELSLKMRFREKKNLAVMLDTSMSMGIKDKSGQSRLEKVKKFIARDKNLRKFKPVFFAFGKEAKEVPPETISTLQPSESNTLIMKNIEAVQREGNYSGILLLTDGAESEPQEKEDLEEKFEVPVYSIGVGKDKVKDVNITGVISNSPLYLGEKIRIEVYLKQEGYNGKEAEVHLKKVDKLIARKTIKFSGDFSQVDFEIPTIREENSIYEVEVIPLKEEKVIENNRDYVLTRVISPKINLLYVDGQLRWEYKFLKRYLESAADLAPLFLVKTGKNLYQQTGRKIKISLPLFGGEKFLENFDIIILGNMDFSSFSHQELANLKNFVLKKGKSLIFLGGENFLKGAKNSPLKEILPVVVSEEGAKIEDANFTPLLTESGKNSSLFAEFPPFPELPRVNRIEKSGKGGTVLLKKSGKPSLILLALNTFKQGKCLTVATDSTWKWRFGSRKEKKIYNLFWGRIIGHMWNLQDYLGIGKEIPYISTSKRVYEKEEEVKLNFSFKGKNKKIKPFLITPENEKKALSLKNQDSSFIPRENGVYIIGADNEGKTNLKEIVVKRGGNEFNHPGRNEKYLKKISESSGGKYIPLEKVVNLKNFLKFPRKTIIKHFAISEESRKFMLPAIFLFLALCWWLRRQNNIV